MRSCVWLIGGATASGKSSLALALAERLGAEILNADATQIYRGLEILSAAPGAPERARVPHHLYGIADPLDPWSVGRWQRAAAERLDALRGRRVVIVGGAGLYFRALTEGLAPVPAIEAEVRARARALAAEGGEAALREELRRGDPLSGRAILPGDLARLARALEVLWQTGRSIEAWRVSAVPVLDPTAYVAAVVERDRGELYARADARLQEMVERGALEEVKALMAQEPPASLPALKALGVREFARCLAGEISLGAALKEAQTATRRYAKRQMTWFRRQTPHWRRVRGEDPEGSAASLIDAAGDL